MNDELEAFASVVASTDALAAAERALRAAAWVPRHGWELPSSPFSHRGTRVVCLGSVRDEDEARAALVACVRAAGVVVDVGGCPDALRLRLLDDLSRLALGTPPTRRTERPPALPLSAEQRALLSLVASGASVPEAADQLFLSRRTAERRMASVRAALGVPTTAAAVAALQASAASGGLRGPAASTALLR